MNNKAREEFERASDEFSAFLNLFPVSLVFIFLAILLLMWGAALGWGNREMGIPIAVLFTLSIGWLVGISVWLRFFRKRK